MFTIFHIYVKPTKTSNAAQDLIRLQRTFIRLGKDCFENISNINQLISVENLVIEEYMEYSIKNNSVSHWLWIIPQITSFIIISAQVIPWIPHSPSPPSLQLSPHSHFNNLCSTSCGGTAWWQDLWNINNHPGIGTTCLTSGQTTRVHTAHAIHVLGGEGRFLISSEKNCC